MCVCGGGFGVEGGGRGRSGISRMYGEVEGGTVSSKWAFMLPVVGVRTGWCQTILFPSVIQLRHSAVPCGWLSIPWKCFWKVTQDKMAILPSALELDLGQGITCGWSQPLVGRAEGLLGTGLKCSNQALGVGRWRRAARGMRFQRVQGKPCLLVT